MSSIPENMINISRHFVFVLALFINVYKTRIQSANWKKIVIYMGICLVWIDGRTDSRKCTNTK